MDAIKCIMTRRSVRSYTDQQIPTEQVEILLKAAMAAPSSKNRQPWEFVVVTDRDKLNKMAENLRYAKMLSKAPLAIAVCTHTQYQDREGKMQKNNGAMHDACAATENILLAAHALGLGAVWTAASDEERAGVVHSILGVPGDVQPLCVISIGYPADEKEAMDKWNPEKVHYNVW